MSKELTAVKPRTGNSGNRVWPLKGSIIAFAGIAYVFLQLF